MNRLGQCDVPPLPPGSRYVEIDSSDHHCVARRSDGSVVAWGLNSWGQCNVPALPPGLAYVEVTAADNFTMARRSDGAVVAFNFALWRRDMVPSLPSGLAYVQISAGGRNAAACRSDGSIIVWGEPTAAVVPALPPGLTYVEVAAGSDQIVARRSDGAVIEWSTGQVPSSGPTLPPGLTYTGIDAGVYQSVARRSDGTAVVWGILHLLAGEAPSLDPGLSYVDVDAGRMFTAACVGPVSICQPSLGFAGPGSATATFCGNGLDAGEKSTYAVTGAPANAPGLLAISLHGFPDLPLLGGTLASFGGAILQVPVLADGNGGLGFNVAGNAIVADLVVQSLFLDGSLPAGVAFTNAVLARYGR
jgi:hypothetical protein